MATMAISVTSQFTFAPDAVYLLEGANVKMKVFEVFHSKQIGKNNGIYANKIISALSYKNANEWQIYLIIPFVP